MNISPQRWETRSTQIHVFPPQREAATFMFETSISLVRVLSIHWLHWKRQPLTWVKTCLKVWRLEKTLRRWEVPLLDLSTMMDLFIRLLAAMKALPWRTIAIVQIWIRMGWQNRLILWIARFALTHPILHCKIERESGKVSVWKIWRFQFNFHRNSVHALLYELMSWCVTSNYFFFSSKVERR